MENLIPKKIHYCWFGGNPLPELAIKCIESWRKYCPDCEIIEWNESNFDINCCDYVREAYEAKKWAFVSDYARFKILYENGGLYFDTDVEIIKPLNEILLQGGFMGIEREYRNVNSVLGLAVAPGLGLAVAPGLGLYKDLLERYHNRHFKNKDGSLNLKTVVDYTTEVLIEYGLENKNEIQFIGGIYIYPKEYFNPYDLETGKIIPTKNTFSIHHYAGSWTTVYNKINMYLYQKINCIFGKKIADFAKFSKRNVVSFINKIRNKY